MTNDKQMRYVLITPCRDEARYARRSLDSVINQTVPPACWVIVDDGSSDETPAILAEYADRHDWIKILRRDNRGRRAVGPGVVDAFYAGLDTIDMDDFDFLCKFDLDLDIPRRYFEILIDRMNADPCLGTCSGKAYFEETGTGRLISEKCGDEMSVGMTKFYRRTCFQEIGGFVRQVMWDGIDCHRCRMLGWVACSWDEPELRFVHLRPMGSSQQSIWTGRMRHGFGQYFMGTPLDYITVSCLFRMTVPPYVLGGLASWWGYVRSTLKREPRYEDQAFRRFLRRYQRRCLLLGKRRATDEIDRRSRGRAATGVPRSAACAALLLCAFMAFAGCRSKPPVTKVFGADEADEPFRPVSEEQAGMFRAEIESAARQFADADGVAAFTRDAATEYRLGPGDVFSFLVRGRPDISLDDVVVSPDGEVALPRIGIVNVKGRTLRDVTGQLQESLNRFYTAPDVTLAMRQYNNNKVYVLGRVANPGAVHFNGPGTLIEALSLAGGLPADTRGTFLSRCVVMRGGEMALWIDLKELLEGGNLALNPRLQNGDFIYIPASDDQMAYIMGQVRRPGVLLLRSEMTVLDALMNSGGLTPDANPRQIHIVRTEGGRGMVQEIDLAALVHRGDYRQNFVLRSGDVIHVGERRASRFNYFLTQLFPAMRVIDFSLNTAERFGAMAEVRDKLWGQEGFVTTSDSLDVEILQAPPPQYP